MNKLTDSSIRCALQVALLGAVTENLRAINIQYQNDNLTIFFYYANLPSEDEEEIARTIATEVFSDFSYISEIEVETKKIVLPLPNKIPELGIRVFHRRE